MTDPLVDQQNNTVDKTGKIRFDFLFSYWIIIWFLIYYFVGFTKGQTASYMFIKQYLNPKVAILLALVENMFTFTLLLFNNPETIVIIKYISMMFIMKGIPLYLLRNSNIHIMRDITIAIAVFILYNIYLYVNDEDLVTIYKRTFYFVSTDSYNTPLYLVYKWVLSVV